MIFKTLITLLVLAGPPMTLDEWLDHWEIAPMAPRLPTFVSNELSYSAGIPQYDKGDTLGTATSTANWCGDQTVAQKIINQDDARIAWRSDSQISGGLDRGLLSMARTWPFTFGALFIPPVANDPFYGARSSPNPDGYLYAGQTHNKTTAVIGSPASGITDVADIWSDGTGSAATDNEIDDPSEIPMPFMWIDSTGGSPIVSMQISSGNAQDTIMYDEYNWMGNGETIKLRLSIAILAGGSTSVADMADSFRLLTEYYSDATTSTNSSSYQSLAGLPASQKHTLDATNNASAELAMFHGDIVDVWETGASISYEPRLQFRANPITEHAGHNTIIFGGLAQRYESDGVTKAGGVSINLVTHASGQNPSIFIYNPTHDNTTYELLSGDYESRDWMWENFGEPNILCYSFGHNSTVRDNAGVSLTAANVKASSAFQGDLFDLIYQDCVDYYRRNSTFPMIVVHIPWSASSMDQTRHDEMVAVVNALNSIGIKTLGIDSFNYWGGDGFVSSTADADWTTTETFALDSGGSGPHPNAQVDAQAAWYSVYASMLESANSISDVPSTARRLLTLRKLR